jgi:hypothetical protein
VFGLCCELSRRVPECEMRQVVLGGGMGERKARKGELVSEWDGRP